MDHSALSCYVLKFISAIAVSASQRIMLSASQRVRHRGLLPTSSSRALSLRSAFGSDMLYESRGSVEAFASRSVQVEAIREMHTQL